MVPWTEEELDLETKDKRKEVLQQSIIYEALVVDQAKNIEDSEKKKHVEEVVATEAEVVEEKKILMK